MRSFVVPLLALSALVSCAHPSKKVVASAKNRPSQKYFVHSWKAHLAHEKQDREPAATIPGLEEFIKVARLNQGFMKVPVGQEVTKEHFSVYDGEEDRYQEKLVYLRQTKIGYFTYEDLRDEPVEPNVEVTGPTGDLAAHDQDSFEEMAADLRASKELKSVKKISATVFQANMEFNHEYLKGTCKFSVDLKKSTELTDSVCTNAEGKVISSSKLIAAVPVNLADYKEKLKDLKITVYPKVLDCASLGANAEQDSCSGPIADEFENDWSFLIK